jgi:hypothetical protein
MLRVCVNLCDYFRETRLQPELNAPLDRSHCARVPCPRDTGEPLREHRGRLTNSPMPVRHPVVTATMSPVLFESTLKAHRHGH